MCCSVGCFPHLEMLLFFVYLLAYSLNEIYDKVVSDYEFDS